MIVGLTGFAGSGKDTAAQVLIDGGFERRAFADPLREGLLGIDPWIDTPHDGRSTSRLSWIIETWGWDEAKRRFPEVRRLQQTYGTEGGRDIHGELCWIKAAWNTMLPGVDYVFTDVRFPNERDFIQEKNGIVIRIIRDDVAAANAHVSEQVLYDLDGAVFNNGSIEELRQTLALVVFSVAEGGDATTVAAHDAEINRMLREAQQRPIEYGHVILPQLPAAQFHDDRIEGSHGIGCKLPERELTDTERTSAAEEWSRRKP